MSKSAFVSEEKSTRTVYSVSFSWGDRYDSKQDGVNQVNINVEASNKIDALSKAADIIACLHLPEPDRFDASKKECAC